MASTTNSSFFLFGIVGAIKTPPGEKGSKEGGKCGGKKCHEENRYGELQAEAETNVLVLPIGSLLDEAPFPPSSYCKAVRWR